MISLCILSNSNLSAWAYSIRKWVFCVDDNKQHMIVLESGGGFASPEDAMKAGYVAMGDQLKRIDM